MLWVSLSPEVCGHGADDHRGTVISLRQRERETDAHHVRVVDAVLGPLARVGEGADDDHGAAEDGHDDGEDA